jgi:hypothetical protein
MDVSGRIVPCGTFKSLPELTSVDGRVDLPRYAVDLAQFFGGSAGISKGRV